jgi:hypothetical protein
MRQDGKLWRSGEPLLGMVKGKKRGGPQSVDGMRKLRTHLTEDNVREIRRRLLLGEARLALGREFQLSKGAIDRIATRSTFDWVSDDPNEAPRTVPINYSAVGVAKVRQEAQEREEHAQEGWEASLAALQAKLAAKVQPKIDVVELVANRLTDRSSDSGE